MAANVCFRLWRAQHGNMEATDFEREGNLVHEDSAQESWHSPSFSRDFPGFTASIHRLRIYRRVSTGSCRRPRLRPHTRWRVRRPTQRLALLHPM